MAVRDAPYKMGLTSAIGVVSEIRTHVRISDNNRPASGIGHPASGIRHPASGIGHRASGIRTVNGIPWQVGVAALLGLSYDQFRQRYRKYGLGKD